MLPVLALITLLIGWSAWSLSLTAPKPVASTWDATVQTLTGTDMLTRCSRRESDGIGFIGSRACFSFKPPQRYRGIYIDEFEGQAFIDGGRPAKRYVEPAEQTWITFDRQTDASADRVKRVRRGTQFWLIDFVGEKTDRPGHYGHMGMSRSELLVDHINAAVPLQHVDGYAPDSLLVRH